MGGASVRPPNRRPLQGRQPARRRERCIQGIRSLEPLGPSLPIRSMRAPRQPAVEAGGSVPGRGSTRSTWNASGGLSELPPVGDWQRFAGGEAAVAMPPTSCKRARGAARWSPLPTGAKSRRQTAPREDLRARSRGAIGSACHLAMSVLERVASPRVVHDGVFTRPHVEAELPAMRVRARQVHGIRTPRPRGLEIAGEAGAGGRSTWNVYGDVRPKAGDVPRGDAKTGRISDRRKTVEATAGPRIPA